MDISVIIVNYNTKDLTISCIRSVYASETKYSFEIIIVDNASSDGSVDTIKNLFPKVRLIEKEHNLGLARACNQAAELAAGRYLYILNSDTEIENDVIEKVVSYGDANQKVGVIGTKVIFPDGKLQYHFYQFPTLLSELIFFTLNIIKSSDLFLFKLNKYRNYPLNDPFQVDVVTACSMFIKREVYEQIGLFNENFFMYYEGSEFCYRVKKRGFKCIYLPMVFVKHFHMGSAKEDRKNSILLVCCFKSAYIYFKCVKSWRHAFIFKAVCLFVWSMEIMILQIGYLIVKNEKLRRKLNMLSTLLSELRIN